MFEFKGAIWVAMNQMHSQNSVFLEVLLFLVLFYFRPSLSHFDYEFGFCWFGRIRLRLELVSEYFLKVSFQFLRQLFVGTNFRLFWNR